MSCDDDTAAPPIAGPDRDGAMADAGTIGLEEEIARLRARLDAVTREFDMFSYSVSHDLRAPLRAIEGFSRMAMEDFAERLGPEGARLLTVVRTNARRMERMLHGLQALSRAGGKALDIVPIDMTALFRSMFDEQRAACNNATARCAIDDMPAAAGDVALVKQVVLHLLSNALKFSRPGVPVVIRVSAHAEDGFVRYDVRDNGVGFDMCQAGRLFGMFQRLHGEDAFEGMGAGLAIVKRIILRHGGAVCGRASSDGGAVFSFTLPATPNVFIAR